MGEGRFPRCLCEVVLVGGELVLCTSVEVLMDKDCCCLLGGRMEVAASCRSLMSVRPQRGLEVLVIALTLFQI